MNQGKYLQLLPFRGAPGGVEAAGWEGAMKKIILVVVIAMAVAVLAQERTPLVVKDTSISTGVVIVTAEVAGKAVELQCNQNASGCTPLKSGKYMMVALPKNWGMYDCKNVDVYQETANPDTDQKLGEYCLIQK
jgi:hypothetical protein